MTIKRFAANWDRLLKSKEYLFSLFVAFVIWIGGYFLYRVAIGYVDNLTDTRPVGDLLLSLIPAADLHYLYVYGITAALLFLLFYVVIYKPDLIPFALKFYAAVFIVRSVFICLTHLGPPEGFFITAIAPDFNYWPLNHMMHSNDLFFSGHVAYPFMGALLLKNVKKLFYFFLAVSVLMAITVLVMRIHYSIDVFAAYFIVYGVHDAVKRVFGTNDLSFHKLLTN